MRAFIADRGRKAFVGIARTVQNIPKAGVAPQTLGAKPVHFAQRVGLGKRVHRGKRVAPVAHLPTRHHGARAAKEEEGEQPEAGARPLSHKRPRRDERCARQGPSPTQPRRRWRPRRATGAIGPARAECRGVRRRRVEFRGHVCRANRTSWQSTNGPPRSLGAAGSPDRSAPRRCRPARRAPAPGAAKASRFRKTAQPLRARWPIARCSVGRPGFVPGLDPPRWRRTTGGPPGRPAVRPRPRRVRCPRAGFAIRRRAIAAPCRTPNSPER